MVGDPRTAAEGDRVLQVLIVDDNRDAADSLAVLLRMWGYKVVVAYDGKAGLDAAIAHLPDCLVIDLNMPYLDGCSLAEHVRNESGMQRPKMVAMTAYDDEKHLRRIEEAGFDSHLVKPADPRDLERILIALREVLKLATRTEESAGGTR